MERWHKKPSAENTAIGILGRRFFRKR